MEIIKCTLDDDYSKKCGEVFITIKGDIIFHCTLCDNNYQSFEEVSSFIAHTMEYHYASDINEECNPISNEEDIIIEALEDSSMIEVSFDVIDTETEEQNQNDNDVNEQTEIITTKKQNSKHQRSNICNICGSTFKQYTNLLGHLRRHSTYRPHECTYCPKSFYTRTELMKHTRKHTGERPYLCSDCGQKFVTASGFNAHTQRHTNERTKQCSICEMKFFSNSILKAHMATHTDYRPHKCNTCNASFKLIKTLKSHLKIHENKRNYHCELCPAKFNQKPGLHSHMKNKHSIVSTSSSNASNN